MFRAAFTSRSCAVPQSLHVHSLIRKPALPFGLLAGMAPQHEQVWVVRTVKVRPALYSPRRVAFSEPTKKNKVRGLYLVGSALWGSGTVKVRPALYSPRRVAFSEPTKNLSESAGPGMGGCLTLLNKKRKWQGEAASGRRLQFKCGQLRNP